MKGGWQSPARPLTYERNHGVTGPGKREQDMSAEISNAVSIGRQVIDREMHGLALLRDSLDGNFEQAVSMIANAAGRLFVTGIGKSGHVGRKIAATLSSTGTQAYFIHATEASHGDLGMIGDQDIVLALSNSGETQELSDILHYCGRYAIPLIGMTSKADSALARASTLLLLLPDAPEACRVGMAPTTSTTMMMALGDAIAVALMDRQGFTDEHFRNFHPGGRLGQKLMRVDRIARRGDALPLVGETTRMSDALLEITAKGLGVAGVVDGNGRLTGIITDGDLRRHMAGDLLSRTAAEIMTRRPRTTRADALVGETLARMNREGITCLFVVDADRPTAVVTLHDCLRAGA